MTNKAITTDFQPRKAVFLDRDGTLIEEVDFLSRVEDIRHFPFAARAVRRLKEAGYLVIVVTNQSGVARGLFGEDAVAAVHDAIQDEFGGSIDGFFHCPHMPDAGCGCRKPRTGMIESACARWDIDIASSWMVGDKSLDVMTGLNAGMRTILVETGYGSHHRGRLTEPPHHVAADLGEAVDLILAPPGA